MMKTKKILIGMAAVLMALGAKAQTVHTLPYSEDFESGLGEWTLIDYNADGYNWELDSTGTAGVPGPDGNSSHFARSASYIAMGGGDIEPDNFMVSPRIVVDSAAVLRWWQRVRAPGFPADHYTVYIATTGSTAADFLATAPVASITPTNPDGSQWWQQSVDLTPYVGDTIRIAFRHHDCFGQYALMIDDITISHFASPWTVADTVPWATAFDAADTGWTFIGRRNGWYIDTVASVSGNGLYVSGDGGATNSYYRFAWDSRFHWAVRPLHFDHGGDYRVDYDWHLNGYYQSSTSTYYDYMRVILAPVNAELDTATFFGYGISVRVNDYLPYGWISLSDTNGRRLLAGSPSWTHHAQTFHVPEAGDYLLLVLAASGNNSLYDSEVAGAIDNLSLATLTCSNFADSLRLSAGSNQGLTVSWADAVGTEWAVYAGNSLYGVTTGHSFYLADPGLCAATCQGSLAVGVSPICAAGDTALPLVSNAYWHSRVFNNMQCEDFVLPYREDFAHYNSATPYVFGWTSQGVLNQYVDTTCGHLDSTSLNMRARTVTAGYNQNMITPRFDAPANQLLVSFWLRLYSYAGMEADTLFQVGVLDSYDTISYSFVESHTTPVLTLLGSDGDGTWRHYQFATDGLTDTARGGLVFTLVPHGSRTIDAYIDELEVTLLPKTQDSVPPTVALTGPFSAMAYLDTVAFSATLLSGDTMGLGYSWHSSLLDSTWSASASPAPASRWQLVYPVVGTDTITVVATNPFGSDTATHTLTVSDNLQVAIRSAATVYTGDTVHYAAIIGGVDTLGLAYRWHSSLLDSTWSAGVSPAAAGWQLAYPTAGVDTITLTVTNAHGAHTATRVIDVLSCGIIHTFPYHEDFEDYGWTNRSACWLIRTPVGILDNEWYRTNAGNDGSAHCMFSKGNLTRQPYDAWLVMPAIELPADADSITFRFAHHLQYVDHFYVLASPTGDPYYDAFTDTLFSAVGSTGPNDWLTDSLPLDAYRGRHMRIAFLHSALSGGLSAVRIDDIAITLTTSPADTTPVVPDTVWRTVTVASADDTMGSVSMWSAGVPPANGASLSADYMDSTLVTLTATAFEGYEFTHWQDGDSLNPRQVLVTGDTTFIAYFRTVTPIVPVDTTDTTDTTGIGCYTLSTTHYTLFPNPASSEVTLSVDHPATAVLLNAMGQEVERIAVLPGANRLPVATLPKGLYFIKIEGNIKKLIVN